MQGKSLNLATLFALPALLAATLAADPPDDDLAAADALRLKGAHEDALALYEQVLRDDPTSTRAWSGAALSLEAVDEERAVSILAKALSEPTSSLGPEALAILADGWARRGAGAKAREITAVEREGAAGRYFLTQGKIYLAAGDFPAGIQKFKEAQATGEPVATYYLGETLLAAGQYDEAALHLDRFLEVFPYVAEARCARAEVYGRQREYDKAEAELAEALTYEPRNKRALLDLAALAARDHDYGRAIRLYGQVTRVDPGDERAFRGLVEAYEYVDPLIAAQKLEEYKRRFENAR